MNTSFHSNKVGIETCINFINNLRLNLIVIDEEAPNNFNATFVFCCKYYNNGIKVQKIGEPLTYSNIFFENNIKSISIAVRARVVITDIIQQDFLFILIKYPFT